MGKEDFLRAYESQIEGLKGEIAALQAQVHSLEAKLRVRNSLPFLLIVIRKKYFLGAFAEIMKGRYFDLSQGEAEKSEQAIEEHREANRRATVQLEVRATNNAILLLINFIISRTDDRGRHEGSNGAAATAYFG